MGDTEEQENWNQDGTPDDIWAYILDELYEENQKKEEEIWEKEQMRVNVLLGEAKALYQKGMTRQANDVAERVLRLDLSQYDEWDQSFWHTFAILQLMQYYFETHALTFADQLFHQYEKEILAFPFAEELLGVLVDFTSLYGINPEQLDHAVFYADKAYEAYLQLDEEDKEELSWWLSFVINYNYIIMHALKNPEHNQYRQLLFEKIKDWEKQDGFSENAVKLLENGLCQYIMQMDFQKYKDYIWEIKQYYDLAMNYGEQLGKERVTHQKLACHFLSAAYIGKGESRLAKHYLQEGLQIATLERNMWIDFADWHMEGNLYVVSYFDGTMLSYKEVLKRHYDAICDQTVPVGMTEGDCYLQIATWAELLWFEGNVQGAIEAIQKPFQNKIVASNVKSANYLLLFDLLLKMYSISKQKLSFWEVKRLSDQIKEIRRTDFFDQLRDDLKLTHLAASAYFLYQYKKKNQLGQIRGEVENLLQSISFEAGNYSASLLTLINLSIDTESQEDIKFYLAQLRKGFSQQLKHGLIYKNREELLTYIATYLRGAFYQLYSIVQHTSAVSCQQKYELVLEYKNPLNQILYLRNQCITQNQNLRQLQENINLLETKLSMIKSDQWIFEREESEESVVELLNLQTELEDNIVFFAQEMERHLNQITLPGYSYEAVCERMADHSVLLEYVTYVDGIHQIVTDSCYLSEENRIQNIKLVLYCIKKTNGSCTIKEINIANYPEIKEVWEDFIEESRMVGSKPSDILLPSMMRQKRQEIEEDRKERLFQKQKQLYQYFIQPVEEELKDAKLIYVASDAAFLSNFSLDMLCDTKGELIGEKYPIVQLDSGRDLLRTENVRKGIKALVIGNPNYAVNGLYETYAEKEKPFFSQLPFGELESYVAAEKMKTQPIIGIHAKKNVVEQFADCRAAHLATHGIFDLDEENSWYTSGLLLAGVENYWYSGERDTVYGNGLLTSDEISRMDLHHMELVVLSSCNSNVVGDDFGGISNAFLAAGVKYVVSSLWEVDDLAALLCMIYFYEKLSDMTVPEALFFAKNKLRQTTVEQMLQILEVYQTKYHMKQNSEIQKTIRVLKETPKFYCVYKDPYYWAGFVCIQGRS